MSFGNNEREINFCVAVLLKMLIGLTSIFLPLSESFLI